MRVLIEEEQRAASRSDHRRSAHRSSSSSWPHGLGQPRRRRGNYSEARVMGSDRGDAGGPRAQSPFPIANIELQELERIECIQIYASCEMERSDRISIPRRSRETHGDGLSQPPEEPHGKRTRRKTRAVPRSWTRDAAEGKATRTRDRPHRLILRLLPFAGRPSSIHFSFSPRPKGWERQNCFAR